jgi:drug/metabolite transporter (DMT)-like permease
VSAAPHVRTGSPAAAAGAFAACSAIWGSTFLAIRIGNESLPPLWGATLRLLLASAVLFALLALLRQPLPRGRALAVAVGYGVFQFGGAFSLLYYGQTAVPSGIAAVLHAAIPLYTALAARAAGLEALTVKKLLAALVALAGVAVIFSGQLRAAAPALPLLAVVGATFCSTLSGILLKSGPRVSPLAVNAVGAAVGAPLCFLASTLGGEVHALPLTAAALLPVAYLAILGSVIAYGLYAWLMNHWDLTRISFITVVIPVVAVGLGALVRGEALAPLSLLGAALVVGAVVVANASPRDTPGREPVARPPRR